MTENPLILLRWNNYYDGIQAVSELVFFVKLVSRICVSLACLTSDCSVALRSRSHQCCLLNLDCLEHPTSSPLAPLLLVCARAPVGFLDLSAYPQASLLLYIRSRARVTLAWRTSAVIDRLLSLSRRRCSLEEALSSHYKKTQASV